MNDLVGKKQAAILELEGMIDFDPTYDYRAARRANRVGLDRELWSQL